MSHSFPAVRIGPVGLHFAAGLAEQQIFHTPVENFLKSVAFCDRNGEYVRTFGKKHFLPFYTDLDTMLRECNLEGVTLMTPSPGRAASIRKYLVAGRHVMTIKPFELDQEAAQERMRTADRNSDGSARGKFPQRTCGLPFVRKYACGTQNPGQGPSPKILLFSCGDIA